MDYTVINLTTKEVWEGKADNAKQVYAHIKISKGNTTILKAGRKQRIISVKEW